MPHTASVTARTARAVATEDVESCPVCSAESWKPVARGFDYELGTCSNEWTFVRCDSCTHLWLHPRPAVAELPTIYPPDYYAYTYRDSVNPIALRAKDVLDARKLNSILRHSPHAPRTFLDVGCGDGRFFRLMERQGLAPEDCYGLELDSEAVRSLSDKGYRVYCERVEDTESIADGTIDLATMFHVIEHVNDPARVLERIAGWLAPGGLLALETPNVDSLDRRLFADGFWGGYHIPRHWNLFSPRTIGSLLERCGFESPVIRYQTGHSFWMYSLHHRLRYGNPRLPALARAFDPLRSVVPLAAFTAFDMVRGALGAKTSSMLVLARKRPG
jgi:SAM-dependent methyltransferase